MKISGNIILLSTLFLCFLPSVYAQGTEESFDPQEISMTKNFEELYPYSPLADELKHTLSASEAYVILNKGTDYAFRGEYTDLETSGTYYCRQCGSPLYVSGSKFHSGCGWPSFDDEIDGAVLRFPDPDGMRTEIVCATCEGHLGHVFLNEGFTDTQTRHCVNSTSLSFREGPPVATAVFAGGCFWGVEYLMEGLDGVMDVVSGYTGGRSENPSYQDVLTHTTGHLEAVRVSYDPTLITYEELARYFLEIHDPTQKNGQGPDIGNQYLSAIFYSSRGEYDTVVQLLSVLEEKGYDIATRILPRAVFWEAEDYHQNYYENKGSEPYCHAYTKRF